MTLADWLHSLWCKHKYYVPHVLLATLVTIYVVRKRSRKELRDAYEPDKHTYAYDPWESEREMALWQNYVEDNDDDDDDEELCVDVTMQHRSSQSGQSHAKKKQNNRRSAVRTGGQQHRLAGGSQLSQPPPPTNRLRAELESLASAYNASESLRHNSRFLSQPSARKNERAHNVDIFLEFIKSKLSGYPAILERSFRILPTRDEPNDQVARFRLMQFNGLGKDLSGLQREKELVPEVYDWDNYRQWRLLQEIVRYNCDLICLQEADFYDDIKIYLHHLGYAGVFCPRYSAAHVTNNQRPDGCAFFYDAHAFKITQLRCQNVVVDGQHHSQAYVIVQLKHLATQRRVTVVCVHLKAGSAEEFAPLRAKQMAAVLAAMREQLSAAAVGGGVDARHMATPAVLLCGDLNGERHEPFYELCVSELHDAYNRKRSNRYKQVDYVFYSARSLRLLAYLDLDSVARQRRSSAGGSPHWPSLAYPSDHFSLVCDFKFI